MRYQIKKNNFVHTSLLFKIASKLLYFIIAFPILWIVNKLFFNFKIEGIKNLRSVKGGKITVSNHVHYLDCTMIGLATFPNQNYFISQESNFEIPFVKWLILILNAIPIPKNPALTHNFMQSVDTLLAQGKIVHFYPEGSLKPYCTQLREFKRGAFSFSVRNNVPIIPCTFVFYKPTGIRKWIKKKPCLKLIISEPIYPDLSLEKGKSIIELQNRVYEQLNTLLS